MDTSILKRTETVLGRGYTIGAILFWAIVIYYAYTQHWPRAQYGVIFLGAVLILFVLSEIRETVASRIDEIDHTAEWEESTEKSWIHIPLLLIAAVGVVVATAYFYTEFNTLNELRVGFAYDHEYQLAYIFTAALLYLTWKAYGTLFFFVVFSGLLYGYFGNLVPGILGHGGFSIDRLMLILVLDFEGFYGFLNRLMAAWIALFLLYAGLLEAYGAFDLIQRVAARIGTFAKSGVAQTAVIGSAIIGSLNGSPTANAGMTGSFTIPLMIRNDVKPSNAAGIETVASTTGMVLPPVMGAAAFVMASLLGISYVDVIIAGLLPATIMVISIVIGVHYMVLDDIAPDASGSAFDERLPMGEKLTEGLKFGIPFAILIWALGIAQYTVMTAALYTSVAMFITGTSFPIIRELLTTQNGNKVLEQAKRSFDETITGFRRGAAITAPVAIVLASINGFIDVLITTGVPDLLAIGLMGFSGGILIIAALLAMGICILLGLGMPATAAYTVVALLIAPTIISEFGMPDLAAHYFVFYAAILSGMIPPVAITALVASSVAGANFWYTCRDAIKVAAPLFVLPFSFLFHPTIVVGGLTVQSLFTSAIVLVGATSMIYGLNYNFPYEVRKNFPLRASFVVFGVLIMIYPSLLIQAAVILVVVSLAALNLWKHPERNMRLPRSD